MCIRDRLLTFFSQQLGTHPVCFSQRKILIHLAPFVDVSRKKIAAEVELEMEGLDVSAERKKEDVYKRQRVSCSTN